MGGHWGTRRRRSNGSIVRARDVERALENWRYSTRPSDRDAVVRRLSEAFPGATVRRGDGAADVLVDDVALLIAHRLDSVFRRDFHSLTEGADELVVYSTTCHLAMPGEWREFKHRHRGSGVRFVQRRSPTAESGGTSAWTVGLIALALFASAGLLAAPLGLFGTTGPTLTDFDQYVVAGTAAVAVGSAFAGLLARSRVSISLLRRLPHT